MAANEEDQKTSKSPAAPTTIGQYGIQEHQRYQSQYVTRIEVISEQQERIDALPVSKRWSFEAAGKFLPIYAGISGLIVNSYLRRMLMIRTRKFLTALPMAILPGMTMKIGWYAFVTVPVLAGELHCSLCGEMRGALINAGIGAVYPMVVGIPFLSAFSQGSHRIQAPKISMAVTNWSKYSNFWTSKLRFFKVQFVSLLLFQMVIGTVVAKKQMDLMQTEVKTKFAKVTDDHS